MAFNPNDPEFQRSARPVSAFANKAFVTMHNGIARISFGEAPVDAAETTYHTAVSLTMLDALSVADAIYAVYDEVYPPAPPAPPTDPLAGLSVTPGAIGALRKPSGG